MPPTRNNIHSTTATKAITDKTTHSQIPVMKGKEDLKGEVHVEKGLQLNTKTNSSDAFMLMNRHKHIYSIGNDNELPQMV